MKIIGIIILSISLIAGCKPHSQPSKPKHITPQQIQKWQLCQNNDTGFAIAVADGFVKVNQEKKGICFSRGSLERMAIINWDFDKAVYKSYVKAFKSPENFQDAHSLLAFEELGAAGEDIVNVKEIGIPNAQAFLFKTKHKRMFKSFYRTRVEIFPTCQRMQITLFFQYLPDNNAEIEAMIKTIAVESKELPEGFFSDK